MRLSAPCKICGSKVSFNTYIETKHEYAKSNGKKRSITCKNCGTNSIYHINDFSARDSISRLIANIILYGWVLFLLLYLISSFIIPIHYQLPKWLFISFFIQSIKATFLTIGIPFVIWGILMASARRKERAYNLYKVAEN